MHISFAVFADGANLSQEGKLNVLGVFDALAGRRVPCDSSAHAFRRAIEGIDGRHGHHTLGFAWVNPSGEELWSSDGELNVAPGPNPAFEMDLPIIAVIDLPLNHAGLYSDAACRSTDSFEVRLPTEIKWSCHRRRVCSVEQTCRLSSPLRSGVPTSLKS